MTTQNGYKVAPLKIYKNEWNGGKGVCDPAGDTSGNPKKWIQSAHLKTGAFTKKADAAGQGVQSFASKVSANPGNYSSKTVKQANLAKTFAKMRKK
jgi:hypothetical protein